jgi:hypothetical protein
MTELAPLAVLLVVGIVIILILNPLRDDARQTRMLVRRMVELFEGMPGALAALSDDLAAQTRNQGATLNDVVNRLEKAADRTLFAARQVAGDLAARELRVDTASSGVASDLMARELRVDTASAGVAEDLHHRWETIDAASSEVAADLAERQRIIDKLTTGVALDLTERQRLIDLAIAGVATDLTAREEKVDAASSGVAEDLAASKQRADQADSEPGAAADAAVKTPEDESG